MAEELREAKIGKWIPKEWRPEYEKIVAFSALGYGNVQIVELMKEHHNLSYTRQHVSNILNTPQADELRNEILSRMRTKTLETVEESVGKIQTLAIKRVKEVLEKDELVETSPFALLDRSLAVLKGVGLFKDGGTNVNVQNNQTNVVVPAHQMSNLLEGLSKANEVQEIHNGVTGTDRK